ncbi:hypothetical protein HU200_064778 [Digitaria exilis]|uniref:Uncharacterized protein n=1 Tax=Digitaria exilis TaxID=1010633 RepID=A0A835ABA8_9POAL|nr:hypothetical protein HU200_064778 [Digitaria exilis]
MVAVVSGINSVKQLLLASLKMLSHLLHSMGKKGFLHAQVLLLNGMDVRLF